MKGIYLFASFIRSSSDLVARIGATAAATAMKPATFSIAGLAVCFGAACLLIPGHVRLPGERVAFIIELPTAEDRGAGWKKFAAAGNFDGRDVARALGALGDSRRIVAAFEEMGYNLDRLRDGSSEVPRVYLRTLPTDLSEIDSIDLRKSVFIKALLPQILRVNEEILDLRDGLLSAAADVEAGRGLSQDDRALIENAGALYGVQPGEPSAMLRELLRRVDIVPPSLALTQAALESGWGTSRFAQEGNALFGQKAFSETADSLLSHHKRPQDVHRMRRFDSLLSSVRSYAHNLNSHLAYSDFRAQRADLRKKAGDRPLDGETLARTLLRYSERGLSYTADLRQILRSNAMRQFDGARLEADATTQVASSSSSGA
jgi:Bax protein